MNRPNTGTPAIQRCVSEREVEDYAVTKDARVFLTSAKTGLGVDDLFQCIASDMGDSLSETESDLPSIPPTVRLDGNGDQGTSRDQPPFSMCDRPTFMGRSTRSTDWHASQSAGNPRPRGRCC